MNPVALAFPDSLWLSDPLRQQLVPTIRQFKFHSQDQRSFLYSGSLHTVGIASTRSFSHLMPLKHSVLHSMPLTNHSLCDQPLALQVGRSSSLSAVARELFELVSLTKRL